MTEVAMESVGVLSVSPVGLGCANFGTRVDEREAQALVHAALDCGVNFFDTANIYGFGRSEEFLGRALRGRQESFVISTKFGYDDWIEGQDLAFAGAGRDVITQAVEGSLRRLGVDCIDLYQQHARDPHTPPEVTLETLAGLIDSGKVREIGCSRFTGDDVGRAERVARDLNLRRFVSCQMNLSLARREALDDVLPACRKAQVGGMAFSPLAHGFLTDGSLPRTSTSSPLLSAMSNAFRAQVETPENRRAKEHLVRFAAERDHTLAELSIAWISATLGVVSVITGASRVDQVVSNVRAATWRLSPEEMEEIDSIFVVARESAIADGEANS